MDKNLLVGNGINIQFGGYDVYSNAAIMNRVINNINAVKYSILTEDALSVNNQIELLECMVKVVDQIKAGKFREKAEGLLMLIEMDRITRTYPEKSSITSVCLEDYFLAFEIFNNGYKVEDGEEKGELYRKIVFTLFHQMFVDGIYNDGKINNVYKEFGGGMKKYLNGFNNIFTTNYDYNLENSLNSDGKVIHMHGEFNVLAPEYNRNSKYYNSNKTECEGLASKMVPNMDHIYSDTIMSWSWLDKYGELIDPDKKEKEHLFKLISGQLEIVGLSPANDEHIFLMINSNPNIQSVIYYYYNDEDRIELPNHLKKPITFKSVKNLWASMN